MQRFYGRPPSAVAWLLIAAILTTNSSSAAFEFPQHQAAQTQAAGAEDFVNRLKEVRDSANVGRFDLRAKALDLGGDVPRIFTFVRDMIAYEVYPGVLRGAAGTLAAAAGNSFDKSQLLAELLSFHGIEVRYATGVLSDVGASELVGQMTAGHPQETPPYVSTQAASLQGEVAKDSRFLAGELRKARLRYGGEDGAQHRALVREAREHAWVQYRDRGEWLDLDSSFSRANVGQAFATPAKTMPVLPDAVYHQFRFRVRMESDDGEERRTHTLLDYASRASDMGGKNIVFTNVPRDVQSLSDLDNVHHFMPVLIIDGESRFGDGFDLAGNVISEAQFTSPVDISAPLQSVANLLESLDAPARRRLSAEWIEITLTSPGGPPRVFVREFVDLIGVAKRASGEPTEIPAAAERALRYSLTGVWSLLLESGFHHRELVAHSIASHGLLAHGEAKDAGKSVSPQLVLFSAALASAGKKLDGCGRALFYRAAPAVTFFKTKIDLLAGEKVGITEGYDIVSDGLRAVTRGPDSAAGCATELGVLQTHLERHLAVELAKATFPVYAAVDSSPPVVSPVSTPLSVIDVFLAARAAGTGIVLVGRHNLTVLKTLKLPAEALERIRRDVADGNVVIVPERSQKLNGKSMTGWWRVDADTGKSLGMMQSGEGEGQASHSIALKTVLESLHVRAGMFWLSRCLQLRMLALIACSVYLIGQTIAPGYYNAEANFTCGASTLIPCPPIQVGPDPGGSGFSRRGTTRTDIRAGTGKRAAPPTGSSSPTTIKPYFNGNPEATPEEMRIGKMLDELAQAGRLPGVSRVRGAPPSKGGGPRSGDYRMTDATGQEARGDLYEPRTNKPDNIATNIREGKSGQADIAIVKLGEGQSAQLGVAEAKRIGRDVVDTPDHSVRRVIVIKDDKIIADESR